MAEYFLPERLGYCLGCGAHLPDAFLDLGEMPPANSYLDSGGESAEETAYKLAVAYCPGCHLVQLTHRVDPRKLFGDYLYFSSFSDAFLKHAEAMAESLTERLALGSDSLVMEIGSNDGYLLQFFAENGIPVLGIEPARNIASVAKGRGIDTLNVFFDSGSVDSILESRGRADVIVGNNVLAHVPLINEFLLSVKKCLKATGSAVFEFPYLRDLLERTEFDTVYHEHVFYYSLTAVSILAERAGLVLYDVSRQDIHGGSLRVFLQCGACHRISDSVLLILRSEEESGLTDSRVYREFGSKVKGLRDDLLHLLGRLRREGNSLAAYGAAAKGSTLLNYMRIDSDMVGFVVDRNPYKQGRLMPGTRIPILDPDELLRRMPDYTLMLSWNFADEILKQQSEYLARGGRFIIPIPTIRVV